MRGHLCGGAHPGARRVALHLNQAYYGYACPPAVCRVVSLAPAPGTAR